MIEYTIHIIGRSIFVKDGKLPRARLYSQGGGVHVYTLGRIGKKSDAVNYHAMQCALRHNVPLIEFRRV